MLGSGRLDSPQDLPWSQGGLNHILSPTQQEIGLCFFLPALTRMTPDRECDSHPGSRAEELTDIRGQQDLRNQASVFPDGKAETQHGEGRLFCVLSPTLTSGLSVCT